MGKANIPVALNDVEIFINSQNNLVGIGEVELPNLETATVSLNQIGMVSEYDAVLTGHYKKLEAKIKMECIDETLLNFNNEGELMIECKGVIQKMNKITHAPTYIGIDVTFKGMLKKFDGPKLKPGNKLEASLDLSLSYYKVMIDGKEIALLDVFNRISNINGETNGKIRRLLGLM
ncbi:phage major tail tube protein [Leptotrichia massiliensis]|jgi:phage tail tube protein FII|uniref:phage major tail tube protein n=1 Tax=Leptotrichia massiliensis TaxID=1852388 RepID=UPI0028D39190|nr:phage major tail tube protein [Leptotrichia massiliensis]